MSDSDLDDIYNSLAGEIQEKNTSKTKERDNHMQYLKQYTGKGPHDTIIEREADAGAAYKYGANNMKKALQQVIKQMIKDSRKGKGPIVQQFKMNGITDKETINAGILEWSKATGEELQNRIKMLDDPKSYSAKYLKDFFTNPEKEAKKIALDVAKDVATDIKSQQQ